VAISILNNFFRIVFYTNTQLGLIMTYDYFIITCISEICVTTNLMQHPDEDLCRVQDIFNLIGVTHDCHCEERSDVAISIIKSISTYCLIICPVFL
jgi:hypothetical protein